MFCHWSPTGTRGWSNLAVRSSRDNVPSSTGWPSNREGRWRLRASTWSGARRDGLVNPGEPLINVVRSSKPKMLTGLSQKAHGPVGGLSHSPSQTAAPSAKRRDLNHPSVRTRNVVSPSSSPTGRRAARRR